MRTGAGVWAQQGQSWSLVGTEMELVSSWLEFALVFKLNLLLLDNRTPSAVQEAMHIQVPCPYFPHWAHPVLKHYRGTDLPVVSKEGSVPQGAGLPFPGHTTQLLPCLLPNPCQPQSIPISTASLLQEYELSGIVDYVGTQPGFPEARLECARHWRPVPAGLCPVV